MQGEEGRSHADYVEQSTKSATESALAASLEDKVVCFHPFQSANTQSLEKKLTLVPYAR